LTKDIPEIEANTMENVDVDTNIAYPSSIFKRGNTYKVKLTTFTISKEVKEEIIQRISMALGDGLQGPFVVLLPLRKLNRRINTRLFTYPIPFFKHKVFIVPYIKEILVYESE